LSRTRNEDRFESNYLTAFSNVVTSDIKIRIVLCLNKTGKGSSKEELLKASLAGNEGIFEYNINELIRSGVVSSDSPYMLTKLGEVVVKNLRQVIP
jgi:predicted transcriptional regulator